MNPAAGGRDAGLSLAEQTELLACRYEMLAATMPRRMVMPVSELATILAGLLRMSGRRRTLDAAFLIELRQQCAGIEESIVRMRSKGGAR